MRAVGRYLAGPPAQLVASRVLGLAGSKGAYQDVGMVALLLRDPDKATIEGGLPADELHVTLKFLGAMSAWTEDAQNDLLAEVESLADRTPRLQALPWRMAEFGDDAKVLELRVRNDFLETREAVASLASWVPETHSYRPHLTLAYGGPLPSRPPVSRPLTLDRMRVAFGNVNHDYPLRG